MWPCANWHAHPAPMQGQCKRKGFRPPSFVGAPPPKRACGAGGQAGRAGHATSTTTIGSTIGSSGGDHDENQPPTGAPRPPDSQRAPGLPAPPAATKAPGHPRPAGGVLQPRANAPGGAARQPAGAGAGAAGTAPAPPSAAPLTTTTKFYACLYIPRAQFIKVRAPPRLPNCTSCASSHTHPPFPPSQKKATKAYTDGIISLDGTAAVIYCTVSPRSPRLPVVPAWGPGHAPPLCPVLCAPTSLPGLCEACGAPVAWGLPAQLLLTWPHVHPVSLPRTMARR